MNPLAATAATGIDVGGTKCLGVTVSADGTVLAAVRRPTPPAGRLIEVLASVVDELDSRPEVREVAARAATIGVGLPGLVGRDGRLMTAPHLIAPAPIDVRAELALATGRAVWVDNDNTVAGLAEWRLGAGRGIDDLLYVGFGTGIGGVAICAGAVVRGANGFAGELGHMVVDPLGPACPCGRRGCWERFASAQALGAAARRRSAEAGSVAGEDVRDAARRGDVGSLAAIEGWAAWVGLGLVNLINVFDPRLVVLGGGLATDPDLYLGPIERAVRRQLGRDRISPALAFAELGERAAAIGAALLPTSPP